VDALAASRRTRAKAPRRRIVPGGTSMSSADAAWQADAAKTLALGTPARWTVAGRSAWAQGWRLEGRGIRYFVKAARGAFQSMIDAEADGLRLLAATRTVRVPTVAVVGALDDWSYVALEWLDVAAAPDPAALGRALAALHRASPPAGPEGARFGGSRDNWIGGTPQRNGWHDDWPAFFRDARLIPQLALAARNGYAGALERDGTRLLDALPALLQGHDPAPSLVHGDLWSGNVAGLRDGTPAIFDPAVYVGDREADLAMTELFGGFAPAFHAAYRDAWPLPAGYALRRTLYNLYHVLNHLNLFGEGYLAQAKRDLDILLAHAG
jgi:protein-ribulosamine 3-kinase